jgi:hypothetical protein
MHETTARKMIESHFVDGLRPPAFSKLQEHLSGCRNCRAYYDRLFGFEAAYDGGKGEVDRIGAQVFAALNLVEEPPVGIAAAIGSRVQSWFAYAIPAAAAAAVLFGVFATQSREPEFSAKGGPIAQLVPQIIGTCFVLKNGIPDAPRELSASEAATTCPRGGHLKLGYRGTTEGAHVAVIAHGQTSTVLYPGPNDPNPMPVLATGDAAWLPRSFAIPNDAPSGVVEISAYFGRAEAIQAVTEAARNGRDPAAAGGGGITHVDRIRYRLE